MNAPIKKKAPVGAFDRIAALERTCQQLVQSLNMLINQANERLSATAEVLNAVVKKLGPEEVQKLVEEERAAQEAARIAAAEQYIKDCVTKGTLVPSESMSDKSTIVGVELTPEGTPVPPGRIQIPFTSVVPDLQKQLLGKGPGTKVETQGGTTFEILEVYDAAVPTPPSVDEVIAKAGEAEQAAATDDQSAEEADTEADAEAAKEVLVVEKNAEG